MSKPDFVIKKKKKLSIYKMSKFKYHSSYLLSTIYKLYYKYVMNF